MSIKKNSHSYVPPSQEQGTAVRCQKKIYVPSRTGRRAGTRLPACFRGRPRAAGAPPATGGAAHLWPAVSGSCQRSPPRRPECESFSRSPTSTAADPPLHRLHQRRHKRFFFLSKRHFSKICSSNLRISWTHVLLLGERSSMAKKKKTHR